MGQKILILRDGTVIQEGSPEELLKKPADTYVARFLGYQNIFPTHKVTGVNGNTVNIPDLSLNRNVT